MFISLPYCSDLPRSSFLLPLILCIGRIYTVPAVVGLGAQETDEKGQDSEQEDDEGAVSDSTHHLELCVIGTELLSS